MGPSPYILVRKEKREEKQHIGNYSKMFLKGLYSLYKLKKTTRVCESLAY